MKRKIVNILNKFLRNFGIAVYKDGFDMISALLRLKKHEISISSVIDIGASDGKWSKTVLPLFPNANFLGIEPLIEREEDLIKLKKKYKQFDYELCAVGELNDDNVKLMVTDDLDGSTISGKVGKERIIKIQTIDSLVYNKKLEGPFLIKFDTHGYEVSILKGAKKTLKYTNVIIMEVYNYRLTKDTLLFSEMVEYLRRLGFRPFDIVDPLLRPLDKTFWQVDLYFAREDNSFFEQAIYK